MGDTRFAPTLDRVRQAEDPARAMRALSDDDVIRALAAASREADPYWANVLASHAMNRVRLTRALMESLAEGLCTLDADGRILAANVAAERMLGWRRGELVGREAHDVFHAHTDECPIERVRASGAPAFCEGDAFRRVDGEAFPVDCTLSPVIVEGAVEGFVLAFHDVTERVRGEDERRARLQRLHDQNRALVALAQRIPRDEEIDSFYRAATEAATLCLDVERASVWLFEAQHTSIECVDLYEATPRRHTRGTTLHADEFPAYFSALDEERTITAHDARSDPRTSEYRESYLEPLGITSMLDAPIRATGATRAGGVVCHEHVGQPRTWTFEEEAFAAAIGDLVSLAIEVHERRRIERELQSATQRLERHA